ncbi:MAG: hypothetical protein P8L20_09950 [Flavobacteriales bacterium]|nr:hypothetical protein [Flavobacteriales bacterium]
MKSIKSIGFILFIGFSFALSHCTKQNDDCDPDRFCDTLPQDSGDLTVKVTYNGNGIPIILYKGYADDNNILFHDTLWSEENTYYLPLGNRYAVEAYYYEANSTIIALDGNKLKESSFWNCDEECYELAEITLDVKKL